MNYQRKDKERAAIAARMLETEPEYLVYYAWPQVFGSTAGPFGGIGGQAISTFTVEAWSDQRDAVLFIGSKVWKRVELFDPREAVVGKYR